jgi:hypothetical protein
MIVYELICADEHRFEGWFASAEAFERQRESGLVTCPVCAASAVEKLPSARIRRGVQSAAAAEERVPAAGASAETPVPQRQAVTLASFIDHVLQNTEDVGRRFPEEARRIHYEEAPRRGIRGVANRDEAEALAEEGIAVLPLPIPTPEDWQ